MADDGEFHDFYKYTPSKAAASVFIVLFLLTSTFHVFQLAKPRVWFFIPIVVGGVFEIVGYTARIVSSTEAPLFKDTPYIIQTLFLLLAPALFAASVYMLLGRLIAALHADHFAIVRRTWMTKIFVTGDILSFVVQGMGGGIMASGTPSNLSLGQKIIIGGLVIQLLFFGFFIFASIIFHRRMTANPTTESMSLCFSWHKHLFALYIASALIMTRSIFRVIEYIQGADGELLSNEVYLYVFDAALMLILMVLLNVVHPREIAEVLNGDKGLNFGDLEMRRGGSRRNRLGGTGSEQNEANGSVSVVDTAYARHAIATRDFA
ncbi:hypothetical protein D8B26_000145 [Coccidioides posadasii str. Silveira]|uniref:Uncharacterized protein n=1 Tax=Coccidioides posadasii (strain RMSCC 757 / Silveira) TaxID=443226 RepID=E9D7Q6_COCPS|nr:conserved hypothetical protein [Coccidioides posadasii str. Silveira]QVM05434.1 hypothetical protein D8B26_000145 [Coccidioides posadasii str. Silveira]